MGGMTPLLSTLIHKRDFYAGVLMVLMGSGVVLTARKYSTGTLMHMGPGFFPLILGVILILLGMLILATAVASGPERERILPEQPEWWAWACILASPLAFIYFGTHGGMAPATFACVFVAALGDRTATLKGSLLLAAGVTLFGVLLFSYVLKVPFPAVRSDILSWSNWFGWWPHLTAQAPL
jgi:putative Ca2+/H+ antiporter (TMEM165/GDT1 family)